MSHMLVIFMFLRPIQPAQFASVFDSAIRDSGQNLPGRYQHARQICLIILFPPRFILAS